MSTFLSILSIFYIVKPNLTDCARCPDIWVMSDNCFLFSLLCIILFESRKLSGLVDFVYFYDLLYCNVSRLRGHFCTSQHDSCAKMQSHIQFAIRDKERTLVACTTCFPAPKCWDAFDSRGSLFAQVIECANTGNLAFDSYTDKYCALSVS